MREKTVFGVAFALALASASVTARAENASPYPACTKPPSKGDAEAAHYAYLTGRRSFDEGDYATAITYFRDAYRRDCTKHELLPIIARAYELSQNRVEALVALETFLKRVPESDPNVDAVKKRIANLKAQGEAKPGPAPAAATPRVAPPASAPAPAPDPGPVSAAPSPSPSPSPAPEPERQGSIAPWFVIGGGVVAAAVGGVVLATGIKARNDASAQCPNKNDQGIRQCAAGLDSASITHDYDQGTTEATVGGIVMGVGAVAVVGGIVWLVVDRGRAPRAALVPVAGPGAAGVAWHARF